MQSKRTMGYIILRLKGLQNMTTDKKLSLTEYFRNRFGQNLPTIGSMVKSERKCWNISQKSLAKKLKITQKELEDIEDDILLPSLELTSTIAKELNESPVYWQNVLKEQIEWQNKKSPNKELIFKIIPADLLKILSQKES